MTQDLVRTQSAIAHYLAGFGGSRAEGVTTALRSLTRRMAGDFVLASELAWEAHDKEYWREVRREDGSPYDSEDAFFEDVLHVEAARSVARRIAIGRMLAGLSDPPRETVRGKLAAIGVTKAEILVPVLEAQATDAVTRTVWLDRAQEFSVPELRRAVRESTTGLEDTIDEADDNARFLSALFRHLPPDTHDEVRDVFVAGMRLHETAKVVAVFLAMVKEVKQEWFAGRAPVPPMAAPPRAKKPRRTK